MFKCEPIRIDSVCGTSPSTCHVFSVSIVEFSRSVLRGPDVDDVPRAPW